jgi:hypothetical protein
MITIKEKDITEEWTYDCINKVLTLIILDRDEEYLEQIEAITKNNKEK